MRLRILIVEDHHVVAESARVALERARMEVTVTGSIKGAATCLREESFDALVVDLGLPNGQGVDVVRRLRVLADVPMVVWTGHDDELLTAEAMLAGADDVIVKGKRLDLAREVKLAIQRHQRLPKREVKMSDPERPSRPTVLATGVVQRLDALGVPAEKHDAKIASAKHWWFFAGLCALLTLVFLVGASYVVYLQRASLNLLLVVALGVAVGLPFLATMFCASQADGEATKAFLATVAGFLPFVRRGGNPPAGQ